MIVDKGELIEVFRFLVCDDVLFYWVIVIILGMFWVFFDMEFYWGFFLYILIDEVV